MKTSHLPRRRLGALACLISVGGFACAGADARPPSARGAGSGGAGPGQSPDKDLDAGGDSRTTGGEVDAGISAASPDSAGTFDLGTFDLGTFDLGTFDLGSTAAAPSAVLPLCSRDGTTKIRLAVRVAGGGPAAPGTAMLGENGWQFLIVDASCHAWLLPGHNDELLQLTLSPMQEETLVRELKLGAWSGLVVPGGGCPDAPSVSFRLDQQTLTGSACGAPAGSAWSDLNGSFNAQLTSLAAAATPVAGDVRYLLIDDDGSVANVDRRKPILWPLAIPAATVAIDQQASFQYQPGGSRSATAGDAAALRAVRTTSKNGTVPGGGGTVFDYTVLVDAQGSLYRLFMRDEVPFAGADGLFPKGLF